MKVKNGLIALNISKFYMVFMVRKIKKISPV